MSETRHADIEGVMIDGRVFVDAAALTRVFREDAERHRENARAEGDPVPDEKWDVVVARHAMAECLDERADTLDLYCTAFVSGMSDEEG